MILFYNFSLIEENKNFYKILFMYWNFKHNKVLPKKKEILLFNTDLGINSKSFLIKPKDLFLSKDDIMYKKQYIILASKRNYLYYKQLDIKYLDLTMYPDLLIDRILSNPLLSIKNSKLYFKYEESNNEV